MSENNILRFPFKKTLENKPDLDNNKGNNVTTFSAFYKETIKSKLEQNNNLDLESLKQEFYDDISNIWRKISFWDFLAKFPSFEIFPNDIKIEIATKIIKNWWFHILRLLHEFYNFDYLKLNLDDFVVWLKHQFICNWKSLEWFDEYIQSLKNRNFSISYIFEEWVNLDFNDVLWAYKVYITNNLVEKIISANINNYSSVKLSGVISSYSQAENIIKNIKLILKNSWEKGTYVIKFENLQITHTQVYEIMYTPNNSSLSKNNFFDISIWNIDDFIEKIIEKIGHFKRQTSIWVPFWLVLFKK